MPAIFHATLTAGLRAIGLELSPGQLAALDGHVRLLVAWTSAINLTAIREPAAVARDHLIDSLAAVPVLRRAPVGRLLDLGSGGGLPGIPLAIALPDTSVLLVESVGKKAKFLQAVVDGVGIGDRVAVALARSESLATPDRERERFDVVTVRAVAALPELIELAFPLLRVGGRLIAWKQEPLDAELAAGRNAARAIGGDVEVIAVTAPGLETRRLVVVTKRRQTQRRFPRSPVERAKQPL